MASFALSEAYAMTHDERLQKAVRRAIGYTLAAQHGGSGGWRYQPGEPGDTSQLGWQFMALKSAELAGIPIPPETRAGMIRYLNSVSSGKHWWSGQLSAGSMQPTRTMTAEALVCRQFLGLPRSSPAGNRSRQIHPRGTAGRAKGKLLLLVLRHAGHVPSCKTNTGSAGTRPCKPPWSAASEPPATRPAVGTPTRSGAPTAAGPTARPWEPCAWRSITAICRSTSKPPAGRSRRSEGSWGLGGTGDAEERGNADVFLPPNSAIPEIRPLQTNICLSVFGLQQSLYSDSQPPARPANLTPPRLPVELIMAAWSFRQEWHAAGEGACARQFRAGRLAPPPTGLAVFGARDSTSPM